MTALSISATSSRMDFRTTPRRSPHLHCPSSCAPPSSPASNIPSSTLRSKATVSATTNTSRRHRRRPRLGTHRPRPQKMPIETQLPRPSNAASPDLRQRAPLQETHARRRRRPQPSPSQPRPVRSRLRLPIIKPNPTQPSWASAELPRQPMVLTDKDGQTPSPSAPLSISPSARPTHHRRRSSPTIHGRCKKDPGNLEAKKSVAIAP